MRFDLRKRLSNVEARATTAATGDTGARIAQARTDCGPTHTAEELALLASDKGMVGRIARGWLRIGYLLAEAPQGRPAPLIDPEAALVRSMAYLCDKALSFVLFAYDWGADPALRVVRLPDDYRVLFDSEYGPDEWACDLLTEISRKERERAFDGSRAVDPIRVAVSSGHGIGKGALTSWLTNWLMSCRPNARGVVTASTGPQLESKTWAQVAAWTRRSITAHWFDISTGRGSMKLVHKERPESWNCFAQTARAENSESFAGLHAADSTPFFLVDESSGVPDSIFEVVQGGMTDGAPVVVLLGNPTKATGFFHDAFHTMKHRWTTRQIDSRTVQVTNKQLIQEWAEDFGEASDFFGVRVLGRFPSASSLQFIPRDMVDAAMERETPPVQHEVVVLGCDIARFGDDETVIFPRVGRDARTFPPIRLRGLDTQQVASHIAGQINFYREAGRNVLVNIDGGGVGGGVVDRLRALGFDVNEVQFGSRADDPRKYANKRCEMYGVLRDALPGLALPQDEDLAEQLTSVEYGFTPSDQIALERKTSMKARGLASPDLADALALTYAYPVPVIGLFEIEERERTRQAEEFYMRTGRLPPGVEEHDPYTRLS